MSAVPPEPTDTAHVPRRRLLRGPAWLVLTQHRAATYLYLAVFVLGPAWILYQHHDMSGAIEAAGSGPEADTPMMNNSGFDSLAFALTSLPVLIAVFVAAPLFAGDQENGTSRLVTTQSMTRGRWVFAKVLWCLGLTTVAGVLLSAFFTWSWRSHRDHVMSSWMDGQIFDNTGPVLPALCLFLAAAGMTAGLLIRRMLPAMGFTFMFCFAVQIVWAEVRDKLAPTRTVTYPIDSGQPAVLDDAFEVDRWIGAADGKLFGWGHCAEPTEAASDACVKQNGIVNDVVEYLGYDQMAALQWTGAGVLLAAAALLTAFTVWRVTRRPL
ncbi:ABC-2 family transporter protein [Streptomyces sp. YIM 130001]|uniref:ABC transporter permease n=1 Tax=Streptomyces sp. YIM 130001 TaxID=2259644 RepID=UPI000E649683|nr:ABC transporter permease [Streptomyces sp. YIM 130001]RII13131.1 ABC-2 family transporter protein [Streptomyces sp. YIM 130001]